MSETSFSELIKGVDLNHQEIAALRIGFGLDESPSGEDALKEALRKRTFLFAVQKLRQAK